MNQIITEPTATAQWHSLVHEAENIAHRPLSETLESYLVFTLIRFTNRPELAASILAIEYLESMQHSGARRTRELREVGDKCLLFSGLFPHLARRRRIRPGYFIDLGRGAYLEAHYGTRSTDSHPYRELAEDFVALTDVLNTIRSFDPSKPELDALSAYELWQDSGSQHARKTVLGNTRDANQAILVETNPETTQH